MRILLFSALLLTLSTSRIAAQEKKPAEPAATLKDAYGDPLPPGAIARIGTLRWRLPNSWTRPIVSPNGKLLAMSREDPHRDDPRERKIEIMNLPGWTRERLITASDLDKADPPFLTRAFAFSKDGRYLLAYVMGREQKIHVIDLANGASIKKIPLEIPNPGQNVSFPTVLIVLSEDQKRLVCHYAWTVQGNQHRKFLVWDLNKDHLIRTFETSLQGFDETGTALSADCRWFAQRMPGQFSREHKPIIEFWDLATGKLLRKLETPVTMSRLAFSPDGKWLAACNERSLLCIYDAQTGTLKHLQRLRPVPIHHIEFAPDNVSLYLARDDGSVEQWNALRCEHKATFKSPVTCLINQFAFQPDGKVLAYGVFLEAVHLWEVASGKTVSAVGLPPTHASTLGFSAQGELFVRSHIHFNAWWNPRTGAKLRDVKLDDISRRSFHSPDPDPIRPRENEGAWGIISPTGKFYVSSDGGVFDARTGKVLYAFERFAENWPGLMQFLPGDSKIAAIKANGIQILDSLTGRNVEEIEFPLGASHGLSVSSSGRYFCFGFGTNQSGYGTLVWDRETKKTIHEWHSKSPGERTRRILSPDFHMLAILRMDASLSLATMRRPALESTLDLPRNDDGFMRYAWINATFSPDGRALASSLNSQDYDYRTPSKLFIFELATKKIRLELAGHSKGSIFHLAYSHDSGLLATGSADTTVLIWQAGLRAFAEKPAAKDATAAELAAWYDQMRSADAKAAFQGMIKLAQAPGQTVKLLADKIPAAPKPDLKSRTHAQWIDDLKSTQFAVRSQANAVLRMLGPAVEGELRAALTKANDLETKRRIQELLERLDALEWTPEEVLHARAVEVLDGIATPEARAVLSRWAGGDPAAVLTQEASKTLKK